MARAAYDERAWQRAYDAFAAAEAEGPLEAEDYDRFAVSAHLLGRMQEYYAIRERAYDSLLARGRQLDAAEVALRRRRRIDAQLAELVRAAGGEGALRADLDPDLVSRLLFGMVNSLVEWYRPSGPVDVEQLADAVTAIAFEGLDR